jgi:hypothetical protein
MKLIIGAGLVLAVSIIPAAASVPAPVLKTMGAQFFTRCTNPPPGRETPVLAACEAYVAGIADGLQAEGKVCVGPRVTADRLLPVALLWINGHSANGGYPASWQIRNGLTNAFPCAAKLRAQSPVATSHGMEQFENIVKFAGAVKNALGLIGLMG